jgi:hypothetical protein
MLPLEARRLFCADPAHDHFAEALGTFPVIDAASTEMSLPISGGGVAIAAAASVATSPLDSIPALDSRPIASAKLFLDFDGDVTPIWGDSRPGVTPAYDQDGDPLSFSPGELNSIQEIWARVSEKYSPFNIDVTTVDPGNLTNRRTLKVVIGGTGGWLGAPAGGVAYVGSFADSSLVNTVFVFPKNLANGVAKYVAEGAAHESGHAFGLQHQGLWSGTTLLNEYNPGTDATAPIMGGSYDAARGLWWRGTPSTSFIATQDDMAIIAGNNGFGYRPDDVGGTAASAMPATLTGDESTTLEGAGVIERTSDTDVYSFTTGAGTVTLSAAVAPRGPTLDLMLELEHSGGTVVASADSGSLGESLSADLDAGTYYLSVKSHGDYGDVGQYTLSGSILPPGSGGVLHTPRDLTATAVSYSEIDLSWNDVADESEYRVERSPDGAGEWSPLGTTAADVTHFENVSLSPETDYYYRVVAVNDAGESVPTQPVSATTYSVPAPAAPGTLVAIPTRSAVSLTWTDESDVESGFHVWRITDGGGWSIIATVPPGTTKYRDAPLRRLTVYRYSITAYNAAGESSDSNYAVVRTGSGALVSSVPSVFSSTPIAPGTAGTIHPALAAAAARRALLQVA